MRLRTPSPETVHAVALAMRDSDLEEFLALNHVDNRAALALSLSERYGNRAEVLVAWSFNKPVAVGAFFEGRPGVVTLMFFAADAWEPISKPLSLKLRRMMDALRENGTHRIEAVALASHAEARRWLEFFGLKPEGPPLRGYGKNGEIFQQYAWVSDACPLCPGD